MNILATGAWQGFKDCEQKLRDAGHAVKFLQWEKDPLPCEPEWVEGVIENNLFYGNQNIEDFPNLRYVQIVSAGYDRTPVDYIKAHGIELHNARGVYSIPMAEFAFGGVLQLYKNMPFFQRNRSEKKWDKDRNLRELFGKRVLILGCGSIGTECAKRFQAFGCTVTGLNRSQRTDQSYSEILPMTELDAQLAKADIVLLSLPASPETRHIINEERLALMKPGAILVNIGRGVLVDQPALEKALEDHLGGAVLDVFEQEPLSEESKLWEMENVVLTPHNSWVGEGNRERMNQVVLGNLGIK